MNELGDIVGQQQQLMDDTFSQQRSKAGPARRISQDSRASR